MRDTNEKMIELLEVSKNNEIYSSLIKHRISGEDLKIRFSIDYVDYGYLRNILDFRPFENTGFANYQYFFALSYRKDSENTNLAHMKIRVEQEDKHKQYEFKISKKYVSNILWFNSLTDKTDVEKMIEK
ncbi:MAG: hypothetical protein H6Q25_722 [Bacteroidetes bacterium]|nr:hypothetical protein [Bacteroidota bacterium]